MISEKKRSDRYLNPITGSITNAVLFGYLDCHKKLIFEIDDKGRPDESIKIGSYEPGTETPTGHLGIISDEFALINGVKYRICGGQTNNKNTRANGIILIDYVQEKAGH